MRAPPESRMVTMGAPAFMASSCIFTIFSACISPKRTAESPEILRGHEDELAVHVSAAGDDAVSGRDRRASIPKSVERVSTKRLSSEKLSGSSRRSMRSLAVSFPCLCWRSRGRLATQRLRFGGERFQFIDGIWPFGIGRQRFSPGSVYCIQSAFGPCKVKGFQEPWQAFSGENRECGGSLLGSTDALILSRRVCAVSEDGGSGCRGKGREAFSPEGL